MTIKECSMVKEVAFSVSAKAARLIGRENITDVSGALTELVKNSYDADAESVLINYDIPFPIIEEGQDISDNINVLSAEDFEFLNSEYIENKNSATKIRIFSNENIELGSNEENKKNKLETVKEVLSKYNHIYIVDNGTGMTEEILSTVWMNIGTSDKEKNTTSKKGRQKTGAKGIGRFALDKLSTATEVYTRQIDNSLYRWRLNWELFEKAELIDDVKAELEIIDDKTMAQISEMFIKSNENEFIDFENNSGTIIHLNPIRDNWFNRDFRKVNKNLKSINPLTSTDRFEVNVLNNYDHSLDFKASQDRFDRKRYDYRVKAEVKNGELSLLFDRNELDLSLKIIEVTKGGESFSIDLDSEFWSDSAFQKELTNKSSFDSSIEYSFKISDIIDSNDFSIRDIENIGDFTTELFFLKSAASSIPILKRFNATERKKWSENFSGIKIYRDNFKVRPYGDDGRYFDWLSLSERQQKNPGAPTNKAPWRVLPYQIFGEVLISREGNPNLTDSANRESLVENREYSLLREILLFIIEQFEADRQYPLQVLGNLIDRRYEKIRSEKKKIFMKDIKRNLSEGKGSVPEDRSSDTETSFDSKNNSEDKFNTEFKDSDIEQALDRITGEFEQSEIMNILMSLSSSGVMASTFAHEINGVATDLATRNDHLKMCIESILPESDYSGKNFLNPYKLLKNYSVTDRLLAAWLSVIITPLEKESRENTIFSFDYELRHIIQLWKPLLDSKFISIYEEFSEVNVTLDNFNKLDLFLILNNFILNSAYYLEEKDSGERRINISLVETQHLIILELSNNGKELSERYKTNPNYILKPGITAKPENEGTGLGLWILNEAVERNGGRTEVISDFEGFKIKIIFSK